MKRSARNLSSLEEERRRIARDLHDGAMQTLACARMRLAAQCRNDKVAPSAVELKKVCDQLATAMAEIRRTACGLRPSMLEHFGLGAALRGLAEEFRGSSGIVVELEGDETVESRQDEAFELAIFRVIQEALHNIGKHAQASRVTITLSVSGDVLCFSVADDGAGLRDDGQAPGRGLGLTHMRERIAGLGGSLSISSAPQEGTRIFGSAPLRPSAPRAQCHEDSA